MLSTDTSPKASKSLQALARVVGICAGVVWPLLALFYTALWLLGSFGDSECSSRGFGELEVTAVPVGFKCYVPELGIYEQQPGSWEILVQLLVVAVPIAAWVLVGYLDEAERHRWRRELGRMYVGVGVLIALGSFFVMLGDGRYNRPAGAVTFVLAVAGVALAAVWLRRHPAIDRS